MNVEGKSHMPQDISTILKTVVILAVFVLLTITCISNIIRHHKEDKMAKEERKRRRSPFAQGSGDADQLMETLLNDSNPKEENPEDNN